MKTNLNMFVSTRRLFYTFCTDEILNALSREFNLHVYCAPNIHVPQTIETNLKSRGIQLTTLSSSKLSTKIQQLALDFETLCSYKQNISFETRIRMRFKIAKNERISFYTIARNFSLRSFAIAFLYLAPFRKVARKLLQRIADLDLRMLSQLRKSLTTVLGAPDIAVMISGGAFGGIENIVARFCKKRGIKSYLIVDNWDNLSSKSNFWCCPDFVGVWGERMRDDAVRFQGFLPSQVHILGSSRLSDFELRLEDAPFYEDFVVFLGSGWEFSDEMELVLLASLTLKPISPTMKIVYRPHPAYLTEGKINDIIEKITDYSNVLLDQSLLNIKSRLWYSNESNVSLLELIKGCKFAIGAHSTSLVEALYFGKKVIAYSYSDNKYFANKDAWAAYSHMSQIRGNSGVIETKSYEDFKSEIAQLVQLKSGTNTMAQRRNFVPNIIPNFNRSYSDRLVEFLSLR